MTADGEGRAPTSRSNDTHSFLANPPAFFHVSYTEMHSTPPSELMELQRAAVSARFEQHVQDIPMVAKLAEAQGTTSIAELSDVVPILFEHTVYKSYPASLLERRDFTSLTRWLNRLTSVDLSELDVSGCNSIDAWLAQLYKEADLDPMFSSGTSGSMSFIPWSVRDLEMKALAQRVCHTQTLGQSNVETLNVPYHYAALSNRNRRDYLGPAMALGLEGWSRVFEPAGHSADLAWFGMQSKSKAAGASGNDIEISAAAHGRRAVRDALQLSAQHREAAWIDSLLAMRGERVIWSGQPFPMFQAANRLLARGDRCSFADGSMLNLAGGMKGNRLPPDWLDKIKAFVNMPVGFVYGMSEASAVSRQCLYGEYHLEPWLIPMVLDSENSRLLPRRGVQKGRFAFFDLLPSSHWGGLITGDEIEIDFSGCACGATTPHANPHVQRLSEKLGHHDKIACTGSAAGRALSMEYLLDLSDS